MSIVLHRFALSQFSEKARACLDFKGLAYTIAEHHPGPGQLALWKLSGQRQVPVLEHEGSVVHDSTAIALYLEHAFPGSRPLLPADLGARRAVLDFEDRLDEALGDPPRAVLMDFLQRDPTVRDAALRMMGAGAISRATLQAASALARPALWLPPARARREAAYARVREILGECCDRLAVTPYLCGEAPTLADLAAVGLTFFLRFPRSAYLTVPALAGVGVPDLVNDPGLARFFQWRDTFYADFLR